MRWVADRLANGCGVVETALVFVCMFVDDVGAACCDDLLFDVHGEPVLVLEGSVSRHQRRAELYYHACVGVIRAFGHSDAAGKGVPPALQMDFLGIELSLTTRLMTLTAEKGRAYAELVADLLVEGEAGAEEFTEDEPDTPSEVAIGSELATAKPLVSHVSHPTAKVC